MLVIDMCVRAATPGERKSHFPVCVDGALCREELSVHGACVG